jgi:hypothetical protein
LSAQRIQRKRTKGWRLPPDTICVSRPSRWGNPYATGNRDEDVLQFELGLLALPEPQYRALLLPLIGKNLACWCPLDGQRCHADVLFLHAAALAAKEG